MSSIRKTKKDVAFVVGEVVANCNMAFYFQPESAHEELIKIVGDAIQLHNDLIDSINNPVEKNNKSLLKKHYRAVETKLIDQADNLFERISEICQKN